MAHVWPLVSNDLLCAVMCTCISNDDHLSAYDKVSGLSRRTVRPLPKLTCHISELTGHRMYLNFCTWCLYTLLSSSIACAHILVAA